MKSAYLLIASMFLSANAWADWPQFRGPDGLGHATPPAGESTNGIPLTWSDEENIEWKVPIHGRGWSSPVVLDGQIWITTADENGHEMYAICVDADTGEILYEELLFENEAPRPLGNDVNSYATPTPAVEEGYVYIHFGSYGTACIDTRTFETVWTRTDLPCNHYRGPAASPVIFEDLLILGFDGSDYQYQAALDKRTGETRWRTDRTPIWKDLDAEGNITREGDFRKAFATPLIVDIDDEPRLLISSAFAAFCYDPRTGEELWKIDHVSHSNASMAIYIDGLVIFTTGRGRSQIMAVRTGGSGDVTATHVEWTYDRGVPSMVSPLLVDDVIFVLNNGGVLSLLDAKTGEEIWRDRLEGEYYASPIYVDGRVYCLSTHGLVTVLKADREGEKLEQFELSEGFMATPAIQGDRMFVRDLESLYCVRQAPSE